MMRPTLLRVPKESFWFRTTLLSCLPAALPPVDPRTRTGFDA